MGKDMSHILLQVLAHVLAFISLGLGSLLFYRIRSPLGLALWPFKILASSLAVFLALGGALGALLGVGLQAPLAALAGAAGAILAGIYVQRVTAPRVGLAKVLGAGPLPGKKRRNRWPFASPRWERDVPFYTPAGSGRPLLCDIWQPPAGVAPTGLAIVYFHSSAWHLADKDLWTRPFFRHLARQGHVVMDVAYRLCPGVDIHDMLDDARQAIAWMRGNAARYGANPERIVAAGASAGAHLALLAAYTPTGACGATPLRAVVSYYGPADMRAYYRHIDALLPAGETLQKLVQSPIQKIIGWGVYTIARPLTPQMWKLGGMSNRGIMANLLGGSPPEVPAMYDLASPLAHAGPHCPPTLLIQGEHDAAIPVAATHALYRKLVAAGVPAVNVVLPYTDHLFDLVLPQVSPARRTAISILDAFLASVA